MHTCRRTAGRLAAHAVSGRVARFPPAMIMAKTRTDFMIAKYVPAGSFDLGKSLVRSGLEKVCVFAPRKMMAYPALVDGGG